MIQRFTILLAFAVLGMAMPASAADERLATDFEIAALEKQLLREERPMLRLSAHLNLGDIFVSRGESAKGRRHYSTALEISQEVKLRARRASDLAAYATAMSYNGLAYAKLGKPAESFESLEESLRYAGDSTSIWNVYASAMNVLSEYGKAIAASRNAVEIARRAATESPALARELDLRIDQYALASSLILANRSDEDLDEAEELLQSVISALASDRFNEIRADIVNRESFEIYSSTRGPADSYLSLQNRSRLRLARLYESRGKERQALQQYEAVLAARSDDSIALTGMSRLTQTPAERTRYFHAAFEANPFSVELIRQYEAFVRKEGASPADSETSAVGKTVGEQVRSVVCNLALGRHRLASAAVSELLRDYPGNDTILFLAARGDLIRGDFTSARQRAATIRQSELRNDIERTVAEYERREPPRLLRTSQGIVEPSERDLTALVEVLREGQLKPEDRQTLDQLRLSSIAIFEPPVAAENGTTTFASGQIGSITFRFSIPVSFRGDFREEPELRMTYRILGLSEHDEREILLIEPLQVARP